MYDVLYIKLKECSDSYGDEENPGIVLNYNYETDELVGIDIWDFKCKILKNQKIKLPLDINLREIFNEIQ